MPITQLEIATQMVRQLRVLDPSVSGEVGTPERKLLDTVAQSLADSQLDLTVLSSALNIDSKFGTDLDNFLSLFGFGRQLGTGATGIVTMSRDTPSTLDIQIPNGTQLATIDPTTGINVALFRTTSTAFLPAGQTEISVGIISVGVGSYNNVAANTVTSFVGATTLGVTAVTNPVPTTGGSDPETDAELKVRFKNTIFRNLAGTADQYLALAVAGVASNKATVLGPISHYREYIQVPAVDDASVYDVNGDNNPEGGNGDQAEFTTALSTNPYSKFTYDTIPVFISNGQSGVGAVFYTEGLDFDLNTTLAARNRGDAYRLGVTGSGPDPTTTFTDPNVTFLYVYTGGDDTVEAIRPGDILLLEYSYISTASRNDYSRNVTNCVDVYVNGTNEIPATTVIPAPAALTNQFISNPEHRFHFDNYRRIGEPDQRPLLGNVFSPLFWNPLLSVPDSLTINDTVYLNGVHYWGLQDVTDNGGTIRARTGIEWSVTIPGEAGGDTDAGPYTGPLVTDLGVDSIQIANYTWDKNIIDLQSSTEASKQITTDVLVHEATTRYFKFDVTAMYTSGTSIAGVNQQVQNALDGYLSGLYFGTTIQLSDILQVIHSIAGIDNVRWSHDIESTRPCVIETNSSGEPRLGGIIDRLAQGDSTTQEQQQFYFGGDATGGTFKITWDGSSTAAIPYTAGASEVDSALNLSPIPAICTLGSGTAGSPFQIRFIGFGPKDEIEIVSSLTGGTRTFTSDFILADNELPALPTGSQDGDSLPGLIIRPRAQNTWQKS